MKKNNTVIDRVREDLRIHADEDVKKSGERFFKENVKMYGIKTATVTAIAKRHFLEIKELSKKEIFVLCEELWRSGYMEEAFVACNWSYALREDYAKSDMAIFDKWVKKM